MPQNILLMLTKSVFENIKRGINWASSKSRSIQVLRQQIWGGWGVLVCADSADAGGGWGVQNYGKHADIILERSLINKY